MNVLQKTAFGKTLNIWGTPLEDAISQMENCMKHDSCVGAALMGDHHLGYAVPVGGVIVYKDAISPSAVGFDIGCGNTILLTNLKTSDVINDMPRIMDEVWKTISFGVGRKNKEEVEHALFESESWNNIPFLGTLKDMAREQLGTVGSGNHYVDIFDMNGSIAVGVHFGSRGLGHKIASYYIRAGGGKDGIHVDPVVFTKNNTLLYEEYVDAMYIAGEYARIGREWVCLLYPW
jgi:tRNA-splicing ligase RtcB